MQSGANFFIFILTGRRSSTSSSSSDAEEEEKKREREVVEVKYADTREQINKLRLSRYFFIEEGMKFLDTRFPRVKIKNIFFFLPGSN